MSLMPNLPAFEVSIQSGELAVRDALAKLLDKLTPLSLDVEEAGTVELVMAEALNNIVEHAYPEGDEGGDINITCCHAEDGLHVTVVDTGRAMPNGQTPLGTPPDIDVAFDDMPEGGCGWFLIKDLAKDVTYQRTASKNLLRLRLVVAVK